MSMRSIGVGVCVSAELPAATLDACLAALRASEAPEPVVVTARPGHGLALARNAVLEQTAADVVAFVDGDVLVAPVWFAALQDAWDAADEAVACIAGPIDADFGGVRPAWLTGELFSGLGVHIPQLSSGPVDARDGTFPAGNASFNASALRGVGGFCAIPLLTPAPNIPFQAYEVN